MDESCDWKSKRECSSESDDESNCRSSNNFQEESSYVSAEDDTVTSMGGDEACETDDFGVVRLNSYDSDLNIIIAEEGTLAVPLSSKALQYLHAGVRATCGFVCGRLYYEVKLDFRQLPSCDSGQNPYEFRIGWSTLNSSLLLGEDTLSFGFANAGLVWSNGESKSYGSPIHSGDAVGALLDMDSDPVVLSYTVNGIPVGIAFKIPSADLEGAALFPHVLTRNVIFKCNFLGKFSWFKPPNGYVFVGGTPPRERVAGHLQPEDDVREVILVCGLPKSGKTTWIKKFCEENPNKYYVLDCSTQIIKQQGYEVDWGVIRKCERKLRKVCAKRNQKFIFEEDTLSHTSQREMMTCFRDFARQAVIVVPSDKEYDRRFKESKHMKSLDHFYVEYMKAKFLLPAMGIFDLIIYPELPEDQAHLSISRYNEEGDRYTSCRGKNAKYLQGKNMSKLINSLCKGGSYDVDLSSSGSESESVSEEISIITASCALRTKGRKEITFEGLKHNERERNNYPTDPFPKKNIRIRKRKIGPRNGDQNLEESHPNPGDDQQDVNRSECQQNTSQIPTQYQEDINGSDHPKNTSRAPIVYKQDNNTTPGQRQSTGFIQADGQQDTNIIPEGFQSNINNTNGIPTGYQHITNPVTHNLERFEYSRNSEMAKTGLERNSDSERFGNLSMNIREKKEVRYPVNNTQIAVYNFSECRVGLTHEGLGSSHSKTYASGRQTAYSSTRRPSNSNTSYKNHGTRGQYGYRRWPNSEARPYNRSAHQKGEGENYFNRFSQPFYQNQQNRRPRSDYHRPEFPGNHYNTNISTGYGYGGSARDGANNYYMNRYQHYFNRYGAQERYPYCGYYWSNF